MSVLQIQIPLRKSGDISLKLILLQMTIFIYLAKGSYESCLYDYQVDFILELDIFWK